MPPFTMPGFFSWPPKLLNFTPNFQFLISFDKLVSKLNTRSPMTLKFKKSFRKSCNLAPGLSLFKSEQHENFKKKDPNSLNKMLKSIKIFTLGPKTTDIKWQPWKPQPHITWPPNPQFDKLHIRWTEVIINACFTFHHIPQKVLWAKHTAVSTWFPPSPISLT